MVRDQDWIARRVNEAHKAHPSVTVPAATRVLELIKGKVMDRQLSTAELREVAKMLLADIAPPAAPKMDVTDAD